MSMTSQRLLFLLFLLLATIAKAQSMLYVEHKGQMYPVRKATDSQAYVIYEGKQVRANGMRFMLNKVDEYYPALVEARDLRLRSVSFESNEGASSINNKLELRAEFVSAYDLQDVFLALELHLENGSNKIFLREIGHLEPNKARWLTLNIPLPSAFGQGTYKLHIFSAGDEVLNSLQSAGERQTIMDALIARRIANIQEAAPQPFIGPPPAYPAKLLDEKITGQAVVRLHILTNGVTVNPVLVEATDPAFGEAAVAAMKQWRFLPKIKGGRAVETDAEIPLAFVPPAKPDKS